MESSLRARDGVFRRAWCALAAISITSCAASTRKRMPTLSTTLRAEGTRKPLRDGVGRVELRIPATDPLRSQACKIDAGKLVASGRERSSAVASLRSVREMAKTRMGTKRNNGELRTVVCRRALLPVVCLVCFISKAAAADINGAWATSVDACTKVFVKKGSQTYLSNDADIHGSGFVIDGAVLRGKIATCKLTSRKDDGTTVHLQAACATDIMVSSNQVDLKMIDQDQLMRIVPGIPEMDTPYYRCPQQ